MRKIFSTLVLMALAATSGLSARAAVLVNLSPDGTGASIFSGTWTSSIGQLQMVGDRFTLSTDAILTGGSIYSDSGQGPLGTPVRFLIYSNPTGAPVIDFTTSVDVVDSFGTASQSSVTRKHATIPATFLAAGTYFFTMPAAGNQNFTIASGNYADNGFRQGTIATGLPGFAAGQGDAFFQLEGTAVPEPSTYALLACGMLLVAWHRRVRLPA